MSATRGAVDVAVHQSPQTLTAAGLTVILVPSLACDRVAGVEDGNATGCEAFAIGVEPEHEGGDRVGAAAVTPRAIRVARVRGRSFRDKRFHRRGVLQSGVVAWRGGLAWMGVNAAKWTRGRRLVSVAAGDASIRGIA